VFKLAPFLAFVPAFLSFAIIPLGGDFRGDNSGLVTWFGQQTRVQLADPSVGVLFALAISSIAVYGIMLAGWSSGSKYPLLGSVRASAQMVSYEAALGLSIASVLLIGGTLSTTGT
jgi:NADH-quinone oxidoreductase subunit H